MKVDRGHFTKKQINILSVISKGNPNGTFVDLDQLLSAIDYETTKQSMQFSIRTLVNRGLIEKKPTESRRGRKRVTYALTLRAIRAFGPDLRHIDMIVEDDPDDPMFS